MPPTHWAGYSGASQETQEGERRTEARADLWLEKAPLLQFPDIIMWTGVIFGPWLKKTRGIDTCMQTDSPFIRNNSLLRERERGRERESVCVRTWSVGISVFIDVCYAAGLAV